MKRVSLVFVLILLSSPAFSGNFYYDGNALYSMLSGCQPDGTAIQATKDAFLAEQKCSMATGYIVGISDSLNSGFPSDVCTPVSVNRIQLRDIVHIRLNNDPESRHRAASGLISNMLKELYPCKKE